jgi:hypothetical protein
VYLNIKSISFFDVSCGLPPQLECSVSPVASPAQLPEGVTTSPVGESYTRQKKHDEEEHG